MFIVELTDHTIIKESKDTKWRDVPDGIMSVHLVHPVLNLSIGLINYDRYAFLCEGISAIQRGINVPRVAENLIATRNGKTVLIWMNCDGQISFQQTNIPEIAGHVWRKGGG